MKTIHNVLILDASGSMAGSKYHTATTGVSTEIFELNKAKELEGILLTQTLIEFSSGTGSSDITEHLWMIPSQNVRIAPKFRGADGGTPLYNTIEATIKKILEWKRPEDKVLLKIFTDGADTTSYDPANLKRLISHVEEENGFTVTFEGTKFTGEKVQHDLGIKPSNMFFHDNTAESLERGIVSRTKSTIDYATRFSAGEDLKANFYGEDKDKP